jgi:plasmid replication initiation protein
METIQERLEKLRKLSKKRLEDSSEAKAGTELACQAIELTKYRNERNLMLFPFCSTSKRKRLKTINYKSSDGKRWLQVTANHEFGMAKIWDFDILRFALSKAGEVDRHLGYFPPFVQFTAYECLKAIRRDPDRGSSYQWLEKALARLVSTTYIGNIFREDEQLTSGFTLIRYEHIKNANGLVEAIKMTFDERLIESVRYSKGLLAIDENVIKEDSGIKKRLLELVKVSKGEALQWKVRLSRLKEMCAYEGEIKEFKRILKCRSLPWDIEFVKAINEDNILIFNNLKKLVSTVEVG